LSTPGRVRIIAGKWRGRKLDVIDSPGLRPTPDRVRETLFNWIQMEIVGARCLDLFAGTGALGFEALSRDASEVVMVESDAKVVESLKQQASVLKSENHVIQHADALSWIRQNNKPFDIIFLDPPFQQGFVEKCCALIVEESLLKTNGLVYIESEKDLALPDGWQIKKQKNAGQVQSMLIEQSKGT
jgi:16S rRNA (guanine966-N2)-methyltransferase